MNAISPVLIAYCEKFVLAVVVLVAGIYLVKAIARLLENNKALGKIDPTVRGFTLSFVRIALYVVVLVAVIGVIGVPMASVITVLASAGLAVGLALQGTLGNLAAGIMLMVFRPFKVGDYVIAGGSEGTVREISLFYTVLIPVDNKVITVPTGAVNGGTITNFSTEALRRVDLAFATGKSEDPARVEEILVEVARKHALVLDDPEPVARFVGATNEALQFSLRPWVKNDDYWTVYFEVTKSATEALGAAGVSAPALRILSK